MEIYGLITNYKEKVKKLGDGNGNNNNNDDDNSNDYDNGDVRL